jgi:hypothetical protein
MAGHANAQSTQSGDETRAGPDTRPARLARTRRRRRMRHALLVAIGVLYVLSVPWYRDTDGSLVLFMGLPDWVAVALGCYIAVAILNCLAWLLTDIDDHDELIAARRRGQSDAEPMC